MVRIQSFSLMLRKCISTSNSFNSQTSTNSISTLVFRKSFSSSPLNARKSRQLSRLILADKLKLRSVPKQTLANAKQALSPSLHLSKPFQLSADRIRAKLESRSSSHKLVTRSSTFTLSVSPTARFFPGLVFKTPVFKSGSVVSRSKHRSVTFFRSKYHLARCRLPNSLMYSYLSAVRLGKPFNPSLSRLPAVLITQLRQLLAQDPFRAPFLRKLRRSNSSASPRSHSQSVAKHRSISSTPAAKSNQTLPLGYRSSPSTEKSTFSNPLSGWPTTFFSSYLTEHYLAEDSRIASTLAVILARHKLPLSRTAVFTNEIARSPNTSHQIIPTWFKVWSSFTQVYSSFGYLPRLDLYLRLKLSRKEEVKHFLRFRFKYQRLFVVLEDKRQQRTHLFVAPGLFLKYFERKKALKKNRSMKFLMMRFLRKVLLSLGLKSVGIITRGVPLHIDAMLSSLFKPLSHPFLNPLTGEIINEADSEKVKSKNIFINSILFLAPRPHAIQKTRKRGRIKRKIRRKLVRTNSLID